MNFFYLLFFALLIIFPNHTKYEYKVIKKRHTNFPYINGSCSNQTKENSLKVANAIYFSNEFDLNNLSNSLLIINKLENLIFEKEYIKNDFYVPIIKLKNNQTNLLEICSGYWGANMIDFCDYYLLYGEFNLEQLEEMIPIMIKIYIPEKLQNNLNPYSYFLKELKKEFNISDNIIKLPNIITRKFWIIKNNNNNFFAIEKEEIHDLHEHINGWNIFDLSVDIDSFLQSKEGDSSNICRIIFNENINFTMENNENGLNEILPDGPLRQVFALSDKLLGNIQGYARGRENDEINLQRYKNAFYIWANLLYRPWALQNIIPKHNLNEIKEKICVMVNEDLEKITERVAMYETHFPTKEKAMEEASELKLEAIEHCSLYPKFLKIYPKAEKELAQYYIKNFGYSLKQAKWMAHELLDIAVRAGFDELDEIYF